MFLSLFCFMALSSLSLFRCNATTSDGTSFCFTPIHPATTRCRKYPSVIAARCLLCGTSRAVNCPRPSRRLPASDLLWISGSCFQPLHSGPHWTFSIFFKKRFGICSSGGISSKKILTPFSRVRRTPIWRDCLARRANETGFTRRDKTQ
jgi:hypothetical protein